MSNLDLATAFFEALAADDGARVRGICADDVRLQQNGGDPLSVDALLGFAKAVHVAASGFRYADPVRAETPTGFVQEHRIRGVLADGLSVDIPTCVVGEVANGKIIALREYFDSAAGSALLAALG